jgi:bifunctional non-homologous end joining protein LigD
LTAVPLTHPERVVFPADGITKGEVVAYYAAVAPRLLPHVRGRPLSLERFRATIDDGGFFQQSVGSLREEWVSRVEVDRAEGGTVVHPVCETPDCLVYLANQGALTLHAWAARVPDLERPDALVLDLDPAADDFAPVRRAALLLRDLLGEVGLTGHPMTTGSRGLHVVLPLDGSLTWGDLWEGAKALGAALVARAPRELTRAFYRSQRRGRLYVDTGRARRGHTAVVPYTVRARPGAPVATPLGWEEVEDPALHARRWTLRTVLERPDDPWAGIWDSGQPLAPALAALEAARPRRKRRDRGDR